MDANFAIGVGLSCLCSAANSLGMGLQRQSHLWPASELHFGPRHWAVGLVFMAFASICSLGNYALLGQARAAAMASLTIVSNLVMARALLKETLTRTDFAASALIMAGIVVAVVFGSAGGSSAKTDLDDILALLRRDAVYASAAAIVALLLACEAVVQVSERRDGLRASSASSAAAGIVVDGGGDGGRIVVPPARPRLEAQVECFARALMAGVFSGLTGTLAKATVVSVEAMILAKSPRDLGRFEIWLIGLSLPLSIVLQLRSLNGGLRRFPALSLVPLYQAFIVICGVSFGYIFFQENELLSTFDLTMFAVGVAISVGGIVVVSLKGPPAGDAGAAKDAAAAAEPLLRDEAHCEPAASASAASDGVSDAISLRSRRDRGSSLLTPMEAFGDAIEHLAPAPLAQLLTGTSDERKRSSSPQLGAGLK